MSVDCRFFPALIAFSFLSACGGGGGDGASTDQLAGKQITYTVSGSVSGLGTSGVVLAIANLDNNQNETLNVTGDNLPGNRPFTFVMGLPTGARYSVSVQTPPNGLGCTVSNGSGTMAAAAITNVSITCTPNTYTVGGSISGLLGSGLVLQNNGGDSRAISNNGLFTFDTALAPGTAYAVTVLTQPSNPTQTCTVANAGGAPNSGNVTNVSVTCTTNTYSVGGSVSGLVGTGLVVRINGGGDQSINSNAPYAFNGIASGVAYAVSVHTQPTAPNQTCSVANPSATVVSANITNVAITCTTNQYTIGGTVSGLQGSGLVLLNNGGNNLSVNSSSFSFPTTQISGTTYSVSIFSQPSNPEQLCSIANNAGTVTTNVSNIAVTCTTLPPMTAISNPTHGATGVARTANPTIDFSVPLNVGTIANGNVTLASAAGSHTVTLPASGNRITVQPQGRLLPQTQYALNVATTVRGQNGDRLANPLAINFITADSQWQGRNLVETDHAAAALFPKVAMNASGMAIATWVHGGTGVVSSRYVPESGTWSALMPIASSSNGIYSPHVAVGSQGDAIVVWIQNDGMQHTLMQSRYSAASNSWTQPDLLHFSVLGAIPDLTIASRSADNAVVGWIYRTSGFVGPETYSVFANRYNFSTGAWAAIPQLPQGNAGDLDQHLSVDTNLAGNISAVWIRNGNVLASHYNATNNAWSPPVTLDNIDPGYAQRPKIALDAAGNAIAVWHQYDGVQTNIYATRYSVATGQWSFAAPIETNNAGVAVEPLIAMDSLGNAVAIWRQVFSGGRSDVVANRYGISSNSWGTAGIIETLDAGDAGLAQLAIDPIGNALAVWKYSDGARFNIVANRYLARTGQWATAAPIELDNGDAGGIDSPSVVLDANGSGIAVWSQSDGARSSIYSNRFE